MLSLFSSLFGQADAGGMQLPRSLVKQLVERALDGTDPRLRIASGYARVLREPVIYSAAYVIGLVDSLPAPELLDPARLHSSPVLEVILYSPAQAEQFLQRDSALAEFRASAPTHEPVTALLVTRRSEKRGFGYGQVGDQTLKDVAQTTVGFGEHRLLEPARDEADTRRGLKRRAFDQLLSVALARITERKAERDDLGKQRALLRSKLDILKRAHSFAEHADLSEQARLQARLEDIDRRLAEDELAGDVLEDNLHVIADVLTHAREHLWLVETELYLDQFYVRHDGPAPAVSRVVCRDLHNSEGLQVSLQLVRLPAA